MKKEFMDVLNMYQKFYYRYGFDMYGAQMKQVSKTYIESVYDGGRWAHYDIFPMGDDSVLVNFYSARDMM